MTNEVSLRDIQDSDLAVFFQHQRDPEAVRMAGFPAREHEAFLAHWAKIRNNRAVTNKTILFQGHVAGNIGKWEQDGEGLVGYWLGREYWGQGVASAALSLFLEQITERPLIAHVVKHNAASVRVLQKCGFTIFSEYEFPAGEVEDDEEIILKLDIRKNEAAV